MAKAFPTDNPFLKGYYGPVNTEADAAHLQITGEMPKELLGTLYRNGPNPHSRARAVLPLVRRRRHDPRLPHRERQRLLQEPLGAHAQVGAREQGRRGPLRHLRQSDVHRPARAGAQLDHRQHQHRLARRQAAGARGGARALHARSREPDAASDGGYETWGNKLAGPSPRIPSSIPRPARWCSSAIRPRAASPRKSAIQTVDQTASITRAEILEGPVPVDGPRFRGDAELDRAADLPAHLLDGARDGRQAAVRLGARQGHAHRLHPAQRHGGRREVGERRPPPTSSIR